MGQAPKSKARIVSFPMLSTVISVTTTIRCSRLELLNGEVVTSHLVGYYLKYPYTPREGSVRARPPSQRRAFSCAGDLLAQGRRRLPSVLRLEGNGVGARLLQTEEAAEDDAILGNDAPRPNDETDAHRAPLSPGFRRVCG